MAHRSSQELRLSRNSGKDQRGNEEQKNKSLTNVKRIMRDIELKFDNNERGAFVIEDNNERIAEMAFGKKDTNLIIYHTEVSDKLKGKGIAQELLEHMVNYAREENLQVVPLCPYVHAQFKRHPEKYQDIWNKNWHVSSK
jgi:uncharacterized protein